MQAKAKIPMLPKGGKCEPDTLAMQWLCGLMKQSSCYRVVGGNYLIYSAILAGLSLHWQATHE